MAKKISQLTQATEVKSDDVTVIVQDGETKKLPLNMMVTKQDIENKKIAGLAKLDEIEATYENDTYTPTITVKNKSSVKVGEGDGVDYSANVMDGHVKSAILSGSTERRVSKNLFNGRIRNNADISSATGQESQTGNRTISLDYTPVLPSTQYTFARPINTGQMGYRLYRSDKSFIKFQTLGNNLSASFTTTSDTAYFKFIDEANTLTEGYQLELGSVATEYEPYFEPHLISCKMPVLTTTNEDGTKSNILTTPEDLELRGIGKVKDELNVATGELTQRIGEIVFSSSDGFQYLSNQDDGNFSSFGFIRDINRKSGYNGEICDKLKRLTNYLANENGIYYYGNDGRLELRLDTTNFISRDLNGLNDYLSKNPITLQYFLATPTIKTVDLMPSGTHPSTTPYCWKNGHIQLSSSGLLPSLEYSVVTSRAGQINQNAAMIVKNDKRIFDLEILLAGGLVNTTYQALTLQNQVETGLSKVSLSSEKEPDYLLYHMIMKLIEEKAYKLDDLTEKVSVFYLYEKLSDEQFETIYAALYPFVEDEYDELPEEAENEVVM